MNWTLGGLKTEFNALFTLTALLMLWLLFYAAAGVLKLERYGLEVHPLYALYRSKRLNSFLERLGRLSPGLWRVFGNVGVAASIGEVAFMTYLLFLNLFKFLYAPERASPVMPLIPGVTIKFESLPWFLAAAGFVILTHEFSHGVQCVIEDIPIKSSALLLAVVTFGGAVEPDEDAIEAATTMSKMRIYAAGSLVNLATGVLVIAFLILLGGWLPVAASIFLQWVYFLSINLALVNMLPIYPLDGGQMLRACVSSMPRGGEALRQTAMYSFIALMVSNVVLSLIRFGLVSL